MFLPFIIFVSFGLTLLFAQRLAFAYRDDAQNDTIVFVVTIIAWLMIFLGITSAVSLPGVAVTLVIAGMVVAKYRRHERQVLLWNLSVAAEKGIPLHIAARAFAKNRGDEVGRRAILLADNLSAGLPLPDALEQSGNSLPTEATLATHLGSDLGLLAESLRQAAREDSQFDEVFRPVFEKMMYLLAIVLMAFVITTFLTLNVLPTLREIYADFGIEQPAFATLVFMACSGASIRWFLVVVMLTYLSLDLCLRLVGLRRLQSTDLMPNLSPIAACVFTTAMLAWFALALACQILSRQPPLSTDYLEAGRAMSVHLFTNAWPWSVLLPTILFFGVQVLTGSFHYARGRVWQSPLVEYIFSRFDSAYFLNGLSLCVKRGWPMQTSLERIGQIYPRASWRMKIRHAASQVSAGMDWCDALTADKLVRPIDAALLRSAQKAGNLSWALQEVAESCARRARYRAGAFTSIAMPIALILLALPIGALGFACIQVLTRLIHELA